MDQHTIIDHYYSLDSKGLYSGDTFWCQLSYRLNADKNLPYMEWTQWKNHCLYLLSLGPDMETDEERYFNLHGEYYEDYRVNTYEEDLEEGNVFESDEEDDEGGQY